MSVTPINPNQTRYSRKNIKYVHDIELTIPEVSIEIAKYLLFLLINN